MRDKITGQSPPSAMRKATSPAIPFRFRVAADPRLSNFHVEHAPMVRPAASLHGGYYKCCLGEYVT